MTSGEGKEYRLSFVCLHSIEMQAPAVCAGDSFPIKPFPPISECVAQCQDVARGAGDWSALRPHHPRPHRDLQELHPLKTSRQENGKSC